MNIATGTELRSLREAMGLSQAKLAEASGIPQHILSSFELEKALLDSMSLHTVMEILSNTNKIATLVGRKKRYRAHRYAAVSRDDARVQRHQKSPNNSDYVSIINSLSPSKDAPLNAVSLFAGCGGLSLGFASAGFKIEGFLELEANLRAIYRRNFEDSVEIGSDITSLSDADIRRWAEQIGEVDAIIGGPPCQGFSLAGKRDVNDPRNTLFLDYLRFVDAFRPRLAVMENVRLLTSMKSPKGGWVRDEIKREFAARGYQAQLFQVNAKDYGVPQHRERVLFIATRNDLRKPPSIPPATHGEASADDLFSRLHPY